MSGVMTLVIFDVEHGACAMLSHSESGRLAMIDSGHNATEKWYPSTYIKDVLKRDQVDYLIVTNADHDHMSDLNGLWKREIPVKTLIRNKKITPAELRGLKEANAGGAALSDDIERFLAIHEEYNTPAKEPFNDHMGGVTLRSFSNAYADLKKPNTNDLSLATFVSFQGVTFLFPGDLERPGWLKLLENESFQAALAETTVLIASHHGRESGFCDEAFEHLSPRCVVFSDKQIEHGTQEGMAGKYGGIVSGNGINTEAESVRKVLTTRSDGRIVFTVTDANFTVGLEREVG